MGNKHGMFSHENHSNYNIFQTASSSNPTLKLSGLQTYQKKHYASN